MIGLIERFRDRFSASGKDERRDIPDGEMRRFTAQFTDEPFEIVEERLNKRFADPEVREYLADAHIDYIHAYSSKADSDELYRVSVNLFSINLFGAGYQVVDLNTFIDPNEKDIERIKKFGDARDALFDYNLGMAKQIFDEIHLPNGSECDDGLYDGYSHEVLFSTGAGAAAISAGINRFIKDPGYNPGYGQLSVVDFALSANSIVIGLLSSERSVIMDELITLAPLIEDSFHKIVVK